MRIIGSLNLYHTGDIQHNLAQHTTYKKCLTMCFGVVDHHDNQQYITLFDERQKVPTTQYLLCRVILRRSLNVIRRVLIFLDNAANTNKNRYLFSWGIEMIALRKLDYIRFCFMVAGHTKFVPDRLFAQVSNSYNRKDVFTITELKEVCYLHADTTIEDGCAILQWRDTLREKYSDLPGTRKYHDFLIARSYDQTIVMKVRESYYTGSFSRSPLKILDTTANGVPTTNYKDTQFRDLSRESWRI